MENLARQRLPETDGQPQYHSPLHQPAKPSDDRDETGCAPSPPTGIDT